MLHALWPLNYCAKTNANLYSLTCKLLQENKIKTDHKNSIVIQYCQIKTHDGWVAGVKFLNQVERVQLARSFIKKDINILHAELGHPSEVITCATGKAMGLHLTDMFKSCEDCTLGKEEQGCMSKKAVECSKLLRERLFFNINSPPTPNLEGKMHCLLGIEDSMDYAWRYFLKEKYDLSNDGPN